MFSDLLKTLFVPSEGKILALQDVFTSKFAFVDSIKIAINSVKNMLNNVETLPSLAIDIPDNRTGITSVTVIDLSWYAPYKAYGDLVITGFAYLFFIWRLYIHLPSILNGVGTGIDVADYSSKYVINGGKK